MKSGELSHDQLSPEAVAQHSLLLTKSTFLNNLQKEMIGRKNIYMG